jgi:predicted  nucleic acid-binding Zn-ribbon protein
MTGVRTRLRRWLRRSSGGDLLAERLAKTDRRLARQGERLARQGERLKRNKELLDEMKPVAYRVQSLYEILAAQVGAIEERLQDLTEKVEAGGFDATDGEKAETRSLIQEVREEHQRIRVRFGAVTQYEERLRRLESALAEEMAAAAELAHEAALNGALANAPTHGAVDIPEDPPAGSTT